MANLWFTNFGGDVSDFINNNQTIKNSKIEVGSLTYESIEDSFTEWVDSCCSGTVLAWRPNGRGSAVRLYFADQNDRLMFILKWVHK